MIEIIRMAAQLLIALGIFNVWLIRFSKSTKYRGGNAENLREEFRVYGLPNWFMVVIGISKVALACCLIAGFLYPALTRPAAMGMALLMLGAIAMHLKVRDPLLKSLPAVAMLAMSLFVALG